MYQALYRKWRPLVFSDVIGQPHIVKTLRTQVESGRLSHAYLFTGSRGTGKTTCAKILARAACCENLQKGDPCNTCPACRGILDGSILDIMEIDAASNSGVENIRSLREESVYSPVAVPRRVYIIDEVHMLSQGAFNALLKTLEEPPPHVLFILATTETHKVPATIVSRCQRFAFHRINSADIEERLRLVAREENLTFTPDALRLLARMADGALRDGLSLLDQCAALANGAPVDEDLCRHALGLSGRIQIAEWLEEMGNREIPAALRRMETLYQSGQDFQSILDELSALMRDLMMAAMLDDLSETRLPSKTVLVLASLWPRERLLQGLATLQDAQNRLSRGLNKRIESELAILRLCGAATAPHGALSPASGIATAPKPSQAPYTPPKLTEPIADAPSESAADVEEAHNSVPPPANSPAPPEHDAQWPVLLSGLNILYKNALENAGHCLRNGRLHITADAYALGLLSQEDFRLAVEALYSGGLELSSPHAGNAPATERLQKLQEQFGSSVRIE